jgi:hypothetical protein
LIPSSFQVLLQDFDFVKFFSCLFFLLAGMGNYRSASIEDDKRSPGKALLRLKSDSNLRHSSSSNAENSRIGKLFFKQRSAPSEVLRSRNLLKISGTSWSNTQEAKHLSRSGPLKRKESVDTEESQDPFAFDDVDLEFGGFGNTSKKKLRKAGKIVQVEEASDAARASGHEEGISLANPSDCSADLATATEECGEPSPHVAVSAECLVSAVKVQSSLQASYNGFDWTATNNCRLNFK